MSGMMKRTAAAFVAVTVMVACGGNARWSPETAGDPDAPRTVLAEQDSAEATPPPASPDSPRIVPVHPQPDTPWVERPGAPPDTPRVVLPGAPGQDSRVAGPGDALGGRLPHTAADARFMQDMIVHHMQALDMAALAPDRTDRPDVLLLARRIALGQTDEIAMMRQWLKARGEYAHDGHGTMHGMLSPEQMARLAASRGDEFDRLFLEYMIQHHEGALRMVRELLASPGAAQDTEIHQFAAHVESDQRIEIERMRRMLDEGR